MGADIRLPSVQHPSIPERMRNTMALNQDYYYSEDHEWINATPDTAVGSTVRVLSLIHI